VLSGGADGHIVLSYLHFSSPISTKTNPPTQSYGNDSPKSQFITSQINPKVEKASKILLRFDHGESIHALETAPMGTCSSNVFVSDTSNEISGYHIV